MLYWIHEGQDLHKGSFFKKQFTTNPSLHIISLIKQKYG